MRRLRTCAAAMAVAALATAPTAEAADHADGGDVLDDNPSADLADLYAWPSSDRSTLTLIMTMVGPVSEDVQYVFHVGRQGSRNSAFTQPPPEQNTTRIICQPNLGGVDMECWAGDPTAGGDYVRGDATASAGRTSASGRLRVHVGPHADPFFFFADGFVSAVAVVNSVASDNPLFNLSLNGTGYPERFDNSNSAAMLGDSCEQGGAVTTADVLVRLLRGEWTISLAADECTNEPSPIAFNAYAGQNVDALVVEVDTSLLRGPSENEVLQVWASTHTSPPGGSQ